MSRRCGRGSGHVRLRDLLGRRTDVRALAFGTRAFRRGLEARLHGGGTCIGLRPQQLSDDRRWLHDAWSGRTVGRNADRHEHHVRERNADESGKQTRTRHAGECSRYDADHSGREGLHLSVNLVRRRWREERRNAASRATDE